MAAASLKAFRPGSCAQARGAASRARMALCSSMPEAAEPSLPSPGSSRLPFFAQAAAASRLRQWSMLLYTEEYP